jgi:hypothetical protein
MIVSRRNDREGQQMNKRNRLVQYILFLLILALASTGALAQKKRSKTKNARSTISYNAPAGRAILWQRVNVADRDLFAGPGGAAMQPDLSRITFIKRESGGHNKKYRIKDGSGRIWVAKPFTEARPETASVRLLWGLGYVTETNYLVPELTIPGVGTFKNVRLEARPEDVDRLDEWRWKSNPFVGTNELQGLKIMQMFLNNNDVIDINNKILKIDGPAGPELHYVISDLGSTLGKRGNNNLPLFYRLGRKNDSPEKWNRSGFIKGVKNGRLILETKGVKNRGLYKDITVAQGRWLYNLLAQLRDEQLQDAFRAANYSPAEVDILTSAAKRRIEELDRATSERFAERK